MSEILRKWLISRLAVIIDYDLTSFEDVAQDGTLLARILYNYGIITYKNLTQVIKSYDLDVIQRNLAHLRLWLKLIGINLSEKEIHGIVHREKLVAARIFYQLYVILNSKSKVHYFAETGCGINTPPSGSPPLSSKAGKLYNACEINEIAVSPFVEEIKEVLRWHKNKYEELKERCHSVREDYTKKLESKIRIVEENKKKETDKPKINYDTIMSKCVCKKRKPIIAVKKPDISIEFDKSGHCLQNMTKAKKYINYLNRKYEKCYSIKKIHRQLNKMILLELMNNIVDKEDTEFKEMITSKLLKQSYYEKQMTLKLIDIRHHKHLMLENLQHEHKKIIKKKEQEFVDELFQQKANVTLREKQFLENKLRQFELHKRLWTEKQKKAREMKCTICSDIVKSIIDLAIKVSEYRKEFNHEVTSNVWNEWCTMFRTGQSIFDYVQDTTSVLIDSETTDDEISLELYRQSGMDLCDFKDYLYREGIWHIDQAEQVLSTHQYEIECGTNILGYIVHRLLLVKYPKPEQIPTPVLPPTDVRAAVIGVVNHEIVPLLQKTLTSKEILVIEMQTVVNVFISTYLEESEVDAYTELEKTAKKIKKKEKVVPEKKKAAKKGSKKSKEVMEAVGNDSKETQTPKVFPGCDVKLTTIGKLGKMAFEILNLGQQINENLMMLMLAEYLKNMEYVKGWVLINFPETINTAYSLEEFYNGKDIPDIYKTVSQDTFEEEHFNDRDKIFQLPFDYYDETRLSKLLSNPKPVAPAKYESIFTSFTFMSFKDTTLDPIFSSENVYSSEKNPLMDFYGKLTVANILEYDRVNFEMLRELVHLITKDVVLANQIFEELQELALVASAKKRTRDDKGKEKGKKGDKKSDAKKSLSKKSIVSGKSKESKIGEKKLEKEVLNKIDSEVIVDPPNPGEISWEYINIPLPKELSKILATAWQDIELVYTNDFKELFFLKRVAQNQIIPYVNEIETNIENFIERPDNKQEFLHEFQTIYNEIQTDLREDEEYKAELHFRVQEFRNKLWTICDDKMKDCETERRKIIEDSWFTDHAVNIVNIYVRAAQLELNRCAETLQFLQDYYSSMALQKPIESKLVKYTLCKLDLNKSTEKINYASSLAEALINIKGSVETNLFISFLDSIIISANGIVNTWRNVANTPLKTVEGYFGLEKGTIKKASKSSKRKDNTLTELDILINQKIESLSSEWRCAIEGEILRTHFRLNLIYRQGVNNLTEDLSHAEYLFHEIYNKIQDRYNEECESIDLVCQLFSRAIEGGEPVQVRLVLDGAKFFIDGKRLFYPDAACDYGEVTERCTDYDFTIAQLNMLFTILIDLAPSGIMSQKLFTFLLEDMLVINAKDCYVSPLPSHWRYLKPQQVNELIKKMYFNDDFIDWKDFIIWNLLISYPSELEILDTRIQFTKMDPDRLEYVNKQQFSTVTFWFEDIYRDEQEILRLSMFKELLCKMFQTGDDKINYSALLLYFCKDEEPLQGVIKALELATGQLVCWDVTIGEKFIVVLRKQNAIETEHKREALTAASSAIEKIYNQTCYECISTFSFLDSCDEEKLTESHDVHYILEEDVGEEEVCDESIPSLCYFLKWSLLFNVMATALPKDSTNMCIDGKSLLEKLQEIYCNLQNKEFGNRVFMHEFLNNDEFIDIINSTSKFLAVYPPEVVQSIIEICTCSQEQ